MQYNQYLINQYQPQQLIQQHAALVQHLVPVQQQQQQIAMMSSTVPTISPVMYSTVPNVQWWYPDGQIAHGNIQQQQTQQHQAVTAVTSQTNAETNVIPNETATGTGTVQNKKPRGPITAYAYFVQAWYKELRNKQPAQLVYLTELSRNCADCWKTMLDNDKQVFRDMAAKDKVRYALEMQSYVATPDAVPRPRKQRRKFKDPNAPKRPITPYLRFCHDERGKVKALNPEYGLGDIMKVLGRKWTGMDAEEKQKYVKMCEMDWQKYHQELAAYKLKLQQAELPLHHEQ
ncbi:high mobility group protein DSP1-like [Anopheles moucheti]|uniref:high mobility group protein DSP1-like n=1 Tax=Anopheles moucheti TaxID=186751 RepID=UPI0022F09CF3|nr:high mobility group protein DSP1-like [Anopheles moucheti]